VSDVANLGLLLFDQAVDRHKSGDFKSAYQLYLASVRADSGMAESWNNLGCILVDEQKWPAAIACCRRAVALQPNSAMFRMSLGNALWKAVRMQEASEQILVALELDPNLLIGWYELAVIWLTIGQFEKAIEACDRVLALNSEQIEARWVRAMALLASGNFKQGFREYEIRLQRPGFESHLANPKGLQLPEWQGENLKGKKLFVLPEQGHGDIIQFLRFLYALPRDIGRILLYVPGNLKRLIDHSLQDLPIETILAGQPVQETQADYKVYLLSLAQYFPDSINCKPYLLPLNLGPRIHRPHGSRLAVGICWAGNPQHEHDARRSSTFDAFFAALYLPGVELYSLQVGRTEGVDPIYLGSGGLVQDLTGGIRDFADTADLIAQLDCIVCVDTAVAHLAGAMGKPCHLLVAFTTDWRWGAVDSKTIWYESVTIHRQTYGENWQTVLQRVAKQIAPWAASKSDQSSKE
jgi:tetratricopeptide (TPR) repeat protein